MSAIEGYKAVLVLETSIVSLLTGVNFRCDRSQTPWRPAGSVDPTQILKGRRNCEGGASKAYVCGDWLGTSLTNCTNYRATFYPSGSATCGGVGGTCGSFSATIAIKSYSLTGMVHESEAAIIAEITFDAYNVAQL